MIGLGAFMFELGESTMRAQLAEVYREVPEEQTRLTPEDVNRAATVHLETFTEGRIHRPNQRPNFKE